MLVGVVYVGMATRVGVIVVGPLFTSVSVYGGLASIVAAILVVGGVLESGSVVNIRASKMASVVLPKCHQIILTLDQADIQSALDLNQ